MDIVSAIAAVSASIDIAKGLNATENALNEAELKMQVTELTIQLADAKLALIDVRDELRSKDVRINQLEENFQRKADLVEYHLLKYEKGPNGGPIGHPFCPRCMDVDGLLVKVTTPEPARNLSCPQCKNVIRGTAFYQEATQ